MGELDLPSAHRNTIFEGVGGVAGNHNTPDTENASNNSNLGGK